MVLQVQLPRLHVFVTRGISATVTERAKPALLERTKLLLEMGRWRYVLLAQVDSFQWRDRPLVRTFVSRELTSTRAIVLCAL
jgi:hypothetical protein